MKFLILVCVICCATAQKYDLKFFEKTNYFDEKVTIDKQKDTVEFDVPNHGNVQEAKYLNDYKNRLIVLKLHSKKLCYAWDMPIDEASPTQIQAGLEQFKGKFPEDKYMLINEKMLPLHYLDSSSLSQEIKDFCGIYPVIRAALFKDEKAMEMAVLQAATNKISSKRTKRTPNGDNFSLCDVTSGRFIGKCQGRPLKATCKFNVFRTCVYKVKCSVSPTGFDCPVSKHEFSSYYCCDYYCA